MKSRFTIILALIAFSFSANAQLKVGRSKEERNADADKVTPKLIGYNNLLDPLYKLFHVGDTTEIFWYSYPGAMNTTVHDQFTFSSISEEKDFYEYVLGIFDDFKDNEFSINKVRIIPLKMGNMLGTKNLAFDIYPIGYNTPRKTLVISKTGWVRLFKNSQIHNK